MHLHCSYHKSREHGDCHNDRRPRHVLKCRPCQLDKWMRPDRLPVEGCGSYANAPSRVTEGQRSVQPYEGSGHREGDKEDNGLGSKNGPEDAYITNSKKPSPI